MDNTSKKTNPGGDRLERKTWKANTPRPPARRAEDGGALAPVRSPAGGRPRSVWVTEVTRNGFETTALWAERTDLRGWAQPMFLM